MAKGSAKGWRALLAKDWRDDDPAEVSIYCPTCAQREFGPPGMLRDDSPGTLS